MKPLYIAFSIALTLSLTFYAGSRWGHGNAFEEITRTQGIINSALMTERAMHKSCKEAVEDMRIDMKRMRAESEELKIGDRAVGITNSEIWPKYQWERVK